MKRESPPNGFLSFLIWFCRSDRLDEIAGDLLEEYEEDLKNMSVIQAKWRFSIGLLLFFKPNNLKLITNITFMLIKSYLHLGLRNLKKNKAYSYINIVGLTLGLTSAMLLSLFVLDEFSYDKGFKNHQRAYRISLDAQMESGRMQSATVSPLSSPLKNELPEIDASVTMLKSDRLRLDIEGKDHFKKYGFVTTRNVFQVMDFELLLGDPEVVFDKPYSLVISESSALWYFGNLDIIGKQVKLDIVRGGTYTITGILKDPPKNAHIQPHFLAFPFENPFEEYSTDFIYYNYALLKVGVDIEQFEKKLAAFYHEHVDGLVQKNFNGNTGHLVAQNITNIHLESKLYNELMPGGNYQSIWIMGALAFFILLIVSINYMNLSTTRATKRMKEIGIRSVLGSTKKMLRIQFLTESTLITCISALVAIGLIFLLLPYFNFFSGKELSVPALLNSQVIVFFIILVIFIGIVGGSYPGIFLSRFTSSEIFRKNVSFGGKHLPMGKILNTIQFTVALTLIILTWTGYQQIQYAKNFDLGFNQEEIIKADLNMKMGGEMYQTLKTELSKYPFLSNMAFTMKAPGQDIGMDGLPFEKPNGEFVVQKVEFNIVDEAYIPLLDIEVIAGRKFGDMYSDEWGRAAIVNEKLMTTLGYSSPEEILNKQVKLPLGDDYRAKIIGVVKNFHVRSLHHEISPLLLVNFAPISSTVLVKANALHIEDALSTIEKITTDVTGTNSANISFLDQDLWNQYKKEEQQSQILLIFSSLTILLSFIGLIGLVSFTVELKMKEMIIRKVFGANFSHIMYLFVKQYSFVILGALLIAIPIANILAEEWLNNFAYRIEMSNWLFIISAVGLSIAILCVVAYHSSKSFSINPVDKLGNE